VLTSSVPTIGFIHTADVHVATFQGLVAANSPGLSCVEVVDAELFAEARAEGLSDVVRGRLSARLREVAGQGADVIICTCSTLGAAAESLSPVGGVPVIRVDRPMAEEAVAAGGRVALVAALASTSGPTRELLEEAAAAASVQVQLVDAPCFEAWELFERGDVTGYLERVADHVRGLGQGNHVDVVVLAQASMAPVATMVASEVDLPVLSSPRLAVVRAATLAGGTVSTRR
jgi:Asp/Glu/hydantoin racemase